MIWRLKQRLRGWRPTQASETTVRVMKAAVFDQNVKLRGLRKGAAISRNTIMRKSCDKVKFFRAWKPPLIGPFCACQPPILMP